MNGSARRPTLDPSAAGKEHAGGGPEAVKLLQAHAQELANFASDYIAARTAGVKAGVRKVGLKAVAGVLGLIAFCAVVAVSVAMLLIGVAFMISDLTDGPIWAGMLAVSILILGSIAVGTFAVMTNITRARYERTTRAWKKRFETNQRSTTKTSDDFRL